MDTICWIAILIAVFMVIKAFYELWQGERSRKKTGRDNKDDFRVNIIGKKTLGGWIRMTDCLKISGTWTFLDLYYFEELIDYGQIIDISIYNKNLDIEFEKHSQKKTIRLRASSSTDAVLIKDSISKHISEYRRKVEIEKSLRIKYKSGNFNDISPNDFEKVVGELFTYMGYSVINVGGSGDGGIDLQCRNYSTGEKVIVQCKRYSGKVGIGTIRDFYGTLVHTKSDKGYIVTTSEFTKESKNWVHDKQIKLVNGHRLSQLMMRYYR